MACLSNLTLYLRKFGIYTKSTHRTGLVVLKKNKRNYSLIRESRVMIHYLKNKVGVVDFANAQGVVMF